MRTAAGLERGQKRVAEIRAELMETGSTPPILPSTLPGTIGSTWPR
ncbi:hypothetical protein QWZ10_20985 [Paracoccus cavernae]|nr:hypothetical protein [Paracoccus cavernae]